MAGTACSKYVWPEAAAVWLTTAHSVVLALQTHTAGVQLQRQQQIGSLTSLSSLHAASAAIAGDSKVRDSMHAACQLVMHAHCLNSMSNRQRASALSKQSEVLPVQPARVGANLHDAVRACLLAYT
jgi:hypothetical protein